MVQSEPEPLVEIRPGWAHSQPDRWTWWVEVGLPTVEGGWADPLVCDPGLRVGSAGVLLTTSIGELRDGRRWFRIGGEAATEEEAAASANEMSGRLQRLFLTLYFHQKLTLALFSDWTEVERGVRIRWKLDTVPDQRLPWRALVEIGFPAGDGERPAVPDWAELREDGRVWGQVELFDRTAVDAIIAAQAFVLRVQEAFSSPDAHSLDEAWKTVLALKEAATSPDEEWTS